MWRERVRQKSVQAAQASGGLAPLALERYVEWQVVPSIDDRMREAPLYPDLSQEGPLRRRELQEMTERQVKRFFRRSLFDCMKDVENWTNAVLTNDEDVYSERVYPGCDLDTMLYAYPNRPWKEDSDDELEQEDLMVICRGDQLSTEGMDSLHGEGVGDPGNRNGDRS